MKALAAVLAVIAGLVGGGGVKAGASAALESFLTDLPAALTAADSADQVRAVVGAAPAEVSLADSASFDSTPMLRMQFPALEASWLATAWRLDRPYAIATDAHQLSWRLGLYQQNVPDPNGERIAVGPITFGKWIISPLLDGRPAGELPAVTAGASPAYDLANYSARVVGIDIVGQQS